MKKIFFLSLATAFTFAGKAQNNLGAQGPTPLITTGDITFKAHLANTETVVNLTGQNPNINLLGNTVSYFPEIRLKTAALTAPTNGGYIGIYAPAYYGAGGIHFNTYTPQNKRLGIGAGPTGNIATSEDPSVLTFRVTGSIAQSNDIFKVLRNTATQPGYLTEQNALTVNKNGNTNFGVSNAAPVSYSLSNGTMTSKPFEPKVTILGEPCQDGLVVRTTCGGSYSQYAGYFSNVNTGSLLPSFGVYGESIAQGAQGLQNYGGYFKASSNSPMDTQYGVLGTAEGCGAAYGVYGRVLNTATPTCPVLSGQKWAGYFEGKVFTTAPVYYTSDERLKTGIKNEESVMEKLLKLMPVTYTYDPKKQIERGMPSNLQHGLIAQRVQEIYPELVTNVVFPKSINAPKEEKAQEYLAVNYTSMIPLLIQGLKEQQAEINELKEILKSRTAEVKSSTEKTANNNLLNANEYKMLQNTPNPFSSETTIQYSLPKNTNNAKIAVFDLNGTLKMQFNSLSGVSKVVINGNSLPAGMYIYSLLIDGNEVLSKKMILTK
jgi:Chaperone of endosialidase/Secretion system C-terminal sorting domain